MPQPRNKLQIGRMPVQVNQKRQIMLDRRTRRARTRSVQQRRAINDQR